MAFEGVGANEEEAIGVIDILVAARHNILAEGAHVAGNRRGHAQPRIGVDVGRADEALHELVGDVIVLGQKLAGEIEGDRLGAMLLERACDAGCDTIDSLVPAHPPAADLGMEQPGLQAQRLAERRALGAQSAEVGGVVGVAGDGRAALPVWRGEHTAADDHPQSCHRSNPR